jgi:8-oxo-dGTP pyrophosphatase MutT (NUDIX family)
MPLLPWITESESPLLETRILSLRRRRARSASDPAKAGDFVVVSAADWVNVVAVTAAGAVVLVEQFRHGSGAVTVEIPGGMVDPGEDFVAAGLRELAEETGYGGGEARLIGVVEPNPAFQTNRCGTLLVTGVTLQGAPHMDGTEEIAVREVPAADLPGLVARGEITHALVVAALFHWWNAGGPLGASSRG